MFKTHTKLLITCHLICAKWWSDVLHGVLSSTMLTYNQKLGLRLPRGFRVTTLDKLLISTCLKPQLAILWYCAHNNCNKSIKLPLETWLWPCSSNILLDLESSTLLTFKTFFLNVHWWSLLVNVIVLRAICNCTIYIWDAYNREISHSIGHCILSNRWQIFDALIESADQLTISGNVLGK